MDESGLHLHFRPGKVLAAKVSGKAILLLDGHASHVKSIEVIDLAVSYNITMVCLPPHTTHYLQPLDRAFFKPLKVHYDNACRTFLSNHPGRKITKLQFGSLLSEAWGRAATPGTASNGFRACGIFPLNADAIPDNAFMPSTVSHVPSIYASTDEASGRPAVIAAAAAELPLRVLSTAGSTAETPLEQAPAATASTPPVTVAETVNRTDPPATCAFSSTPTKTTPTTFAMLHPTPKINRARRPAANKTTQKAAVLTSPAYRCSLTDKLESSDNSKKATTKRRLSKAKKASPATKKSNLNKKSEVKASSIHRSITASNAPSMINYYCGGCGELYDNSRSDWLQCVRCLEWWELDCSGMLGKSKEEQDQFCCADCD